MISFFTTLLIFIVIISLVVIVHELGHFLAARVTGMEVEEFAVGMGPTLWKKKHSQSKHIARVIDFLVLKRREQTVSVGGITETTIEEEVVMASVPSGDKNQKQLSEGLSDGVAGEAVDGGHIDTTYSIKLFPIGGYVKILGEEEDVAVPGSFSEKSVWARMLVACAGVFMNFMLGAVFYYIVLGAGGWVYENIPYYEGFSVVFGEQEIGYAYPVTIVGTVEDSPAVEAGLEAGWEILSVDGTEVDTTVELKELVSPHEDGTVELLLNDMETGEQKTVEVGVGDDGTMGVELSRDYEVLSIKYDGVNRLFAGFLHEINMAKANMFIIKELVSQSIEEKTVVPVAQSVAGPVGLVAVIDVVRKYGGLMGILDLVGMFNVALVMMNVLPFPALDGGHVLFLGIEAVRGKPINRNFQQKAFSIGMLLLFLFMIVVSVKDVVQFGVWDWVKGLFS